MGRNSQVYLEGRDVHGSDRIVGFLGSDRTGSDLPYHLQWKYLMIDEVFVWPQAIYVTTDCNSARHALTLKLTLSFVVLSRNI